MRYRTTITSEEDGQVGSFEYVWVDGKLISIVFVSDGSTQTAKYLYNDFDEPIGMVVTSESGTLATYYYLKNAQGDITNIVSAGGAKLIEFTYDVFGNPTVHYQADPSTIIGMMNLAEQVIVRILTPFGYRGYCYDPYSGLYYLQSRYYDPQTGRFINADDTNYLNATGTVIGCNLFAYCENDPVNRVDPKGRMPAVLAAAFSVVGVSAFMYTTFLCVRLYCWGFTHRTKKQTYNFSQKWKSILKRRVDGAITISSVVSKYIEYMKKKNLKSFTTDCSLSFYKNVKKTLADLDLTLAIGGGGKFKITINKTEEVNWVGETYYKVTVKMKNEVFNFEYWKMKIFNKEFGVVDPHSTSMLIKLINNTGYFTQTFGAFVPFTWNFTVSFKTAW